MVENAVCLKKDEKQLVIALSGGIDSSNASEVSAAIDEIWGGDSNLQLVFDFEDLFYISSAGLRILMVLQKKVSGKIKVINASKDVYDILDMTGFTTILDVHRPIRTISIEGAVEIGKGANGTVYRTGPDMIYKIFNAGKPIEEVDKECDLAKRAFLKGIPTAISYDVVRLEDGRLGIGFEMLNAASLSSTISTHPEQFDELASEYVHVYKMFHEMEVSPDEFPSAKEIFMGYIDGCKDWYTEEELDALKRLVLSIPDRKTLIHGDYHAHNIMCENNELIMIDMGDVSYGHPVFDFLATAATQANLVELNPDYAEIHTGMPVEYIKKLWNYLIENYFTGKSREELEAIDKQIRLFSKLKVAVAPVVGRGAPEEVLRQSVNDARATLLPNIDSLIGSVDW